jgi:hypothetical protein
MVRKMDRGCGAPAIACPSCKASAREPAMPRRGLRRPTVRMIYRAYVLTIQGDARQYQEFDCENDEQALSLAAELIGDHAVEVWLGPRRIARLTASSRSLPPSQKI